MAAPEKLGKAQRNHSPEDRTDQWQKPGTDHCRGESHLARMVWLFQAQPEKCVRRPGQLDTRTNASHPAQAPPSERMGADARPQALAECLLRRTRAILDGHSPCPSEPISMEKSLTGEPDAGNPPVRFGGRGGVKTPSLPLFFPLDTAPDGDPDGAWFILCCRTTKMSALTALRTKT